MNNDEILDSTFEDIEIIGRRGKIKHAMNIARRDTEGYIKAEVFRIASLLPLDTRKTFKEAIAKVSNVEDARVIK